MDPLGARACFYRGDPFPRVFKGSQTLAALFFLTYLLAAGFVGYTGYLGGELVLEHGAGFRNVLSLSPLPFEEPPKGP